MEKIKTERLKYFELTETISLKRLRIRLSQIVNTVEALEAKIFKIRISAVLIGDPTK